MDVVTYDRPTVKGVSKRVLIGTEYHDVAEGDVIYIGPNEQHELRAGPDGPLGFICVAPKP